MAFKEKGRLLAEVVGELSKTGDYAERASKKEELESRLEDLNASLHDAISQNHDGFMASLHAFFHVTQSIDDSKAKITSLRGALMSCKTHLQCKRENIQKLYTQSLEFKEIVRILEKIEEVKRVPTKIDEFVNSKHFVNAATLIIDTANQLKTEALAQVGALRDIERDLENKLEVMHEAILKAMSAHLFLKDRQSILGVLAQTPFDENAQLFEDPDVDVEGNSYTFLALCVHSATIINKVQDVITGIVLSLKNEVSLIIEKCVVFAQEQFVHSADSVVNGHIIATPPPNILFKFLNYLYNRLFHVLQRHVFVIRLIQPLKLSVQDHAEFAFYNTSEIWKAMQLEIEMLLCQYLNLGEDTQSLLISAFSNSDGPNLASDLPTSNSTEDTTQAFFSTKSKVGDRKRLQPLFSFANSQNAIAEATYTFETSLTEAGSQSAQMKQANTMSDRYTGTSMQSQQQLVKSDIANIKGIYKPTVVFTENVSRFLTTKGGDVSDFKIFEFCPLRQFIDNFVKHQYLNNVKETIKKNVQGLSDSLDIPIDHLRNDNESRPLLTSAVSCHNLISMLCGLIIDLPFYCSEFVTMMQSLLTEYRGICTQKLDSYVSLPSLSSGGLRSGNVSLSFEWMAEKSLIYSIKQNSAWADYLTDKNRNPNEIEDGIEASAFPQSGEAEILLHLVGDLLINKSDVIQDLNAIKNIAHLHISSDWISGQIATIASSIANEPTVFVGLWQDKSNTQDIDDRITASSIAKFLPPQSINQLHLISVEYQQLSDDCLILLRNEIRIHCIYYLLPCIKKVNYLCDISMVEPDLQIISLGKDLNAIEATMALCLPKRALLYIFDGLAEFICNIFIANMRHIRRMNNYGVKRMCRGIFSLQQSIQKLIPESQLGHLDLARHYYEMINFSPETVIENIKTQGIVFTEDEYGVAIGLICASAPQLDETAYSSSIEQLHDCFQELL